MRTRRILTAATVLAFAISAIIVMTASAAPSPRKGTQTKATQYFQIKGAKSTQFAASPKKPLNNRTTQSHRQQSLPRPGQGKNTRLPNGGGGSIPVIPGVDPTNSNPKLLNRANGLNSVDNAGVNGFDLTPPDQAFCVGAGWAMEGVNLAFKIYRANLSEYSGDMALNTFFAVSPDDFTSDPKCYYDSDTGRWFATALGVAANTDFHTSYVAIAVSRTPNPNLGWNVYYLNTTNDGSVGTGDNPGCPCFGDQPLIGASRDAFLVSTNEYSLGGVFFAGPFSYHGSQLYALDKRALAEGFLGSMVNVGYFNVGLVVATPDGTCDDKANPGFWCWYSLQPTTAPAAKYDNSSMGTEWLLSSLDFANQFCGCPGSLDHRITVWDVENLSSLRTFDPDITLNGLTLDTETYGGPQNARQKSGRIPLGDDVYGAAGVVGAVATNDDRMNQTVYANGLVWGAVNTILKTGALHATHTGTAWFAFSPNTGKGPIATLMAQGYIGARGEDLDFPSIAVLQNGQAVIANILTGKNYYPSMAYSLGNVHGFNSIHVGTEGQSPLDDFCEYDLACGGGSVRPRAGDYTAAVAHNGKFYIATEGIQFANCSDAAFLIDPSCGGTRSVYVNWGTFLGVLMP